MLKDHIRDYATEAFRLYARRGRPTVEQIEREIRVRAEAIHPEVLVGGHIGKPTEAALMAREAALEQRKGELLDIIAVESALRLLKKRGKTDAVRAVELVYFVAPGRSIRRGEICERVLAASQVLPASERAVFKWLREARTLFAHERELRL